MLKLYQRGCSMLYVQPLFVNSTTAIAKKAGYKLQPATQLHAG